ncbi:MAG: hypothetical protein M1832_000347 [Thelocarpon impressellum]|nr:MAG: hypothetical protein M1832_000347 [Thelocarpon impressellum]
MPYSPATPEVTPGNHGGAYRAHAIANGQGSAAKGKHRGPAPEPSPASTYGGTAAGDSVPVTPQEPGAKDPLRQRAPKALNFNAVVHGAGEQDQVSPTIGEEDDLVDLHTEADSKQLVLSLTTAADRYVSTQTLRRGSLAPSTPSPSGRLEKHAAVDGSIKRPTPFVVHGKDSKDDDPFVSTSRQPSTPNRQAATTLNAQPAPSSLSERQVVPARRSEKAMERVDAKDPTPRLARNGEPLSAENAQAVLPPSACVFVANLASACTDEHLEQSVAVIFKQFGTVYVKIRRDNRGMPYAFCQYEHDEDARRAIVGGRRQVIDGRPCRTEPAKVNRSLYMSRLTGGKIAEGEARRVLHPFGPIEACWWSSRTEREMYQLPEGIWVKFAYFQDCRDAQSAFRDDSSYRLEQPATPPDATNRAQQLRALQAPRNPWAARPPLRLEYRPTNEVLARQELDRRSIFIGNLTEGTTKERIMSAFREYGSIVTADVIAKPAAHPGIGYNTFAFVEYNREDEATHAIQSLHHQMFDGQRIRVERKESVELLSRRFPVDYFGTQGYSADAMEALREQFKRAGLHIEQQRQALAYFYHHANGTAQVGAPTALGMPADGAPIPPPIFGSGAPQGYVGPPYDPAQASVGGSGASSGGAAVAQYAGFTQHGEHEQVNGLSPSRSPFPNAGYDATAVYGQGQETGVASQSTTQAGPIPALDLYQYQQYQQHLAGFQQYPSYYPMTYYQYPAPIPPVPGMLPSPATAQVHAQGFDQTRPTIANTAAGTNRLPADVRASR